ncbi:MAG: efflux RND transporter periplasmic adaptor subunit [Caldilineales bacterium]|nr:efflux RND transporter periplasmic adaptor subunit [Caldilineales bacterium]
MKTIIRILLFIIVIGAIVAGGYWFYQNRFAAETASASTSDFTQVVAVQEGNLDASISVVGELASAKQQDLKFDRVSGATTLQSLDVSPGAVVQAGQQLAAIDPEPYQQARDQAESAWQEAVEVLNDLQTPATDLQIAQADLKVAQAKLDLENAQQDLADLQSLDLTDLEQTLKSAQDSLQLAQYQQTLTEHDSLAKSERDLTYAADWHDRRIWELKDLIANGKANLEQQEELGTQQETLAEVQADLARVQAQRQLAIQTAAATVAETQATVADAAEALAEARAGGDALTLAEAQLAVREAEVALAAAEDSRSDLGSGADATDLAAAQADVDKKKLALAEAEADLAGTTLTAPFAGTILKTNADPGDRVSASSTILTLANMDALQVIASVDETTIRQVTAGQPAQITFDAFPGSTYAGTVDSVPLQGALQGDVMVYEVPISLQGVESLPLLVGMTANVDIQVGQAQNALLVPTMALQNVGGFYQVLVANSGDPTAEPETVPVEVGLSDGVYTEIKRGLNAGDQVVMQISSGSNSNIFGPGGGGRTNGGVFIGGFGGPGR